MSTREDLGRLVHQVWDEWAKECSGSTKTITWNQIGDEEREIDMRIGEQLYQAGFEAGADSMISHD